MSETRTVSPTLEERLAGVMLKTVRNFYAPESWMDGSWAEPEMLSDVRAHATPYFLAAAKEHGLVIGEGELDAAWKEAEAALPEGWILHLNGHKDGSAQAWARTTVSLHTEEQRRAIQRTRLGSSVSVSGPTLVAALLALREKLRDSRR